MKRYIIEENVKVVMICQVNAKNKREALKLHNQNKSDQTASLQGNNQKDVVVYEAIPDQETHDKKDAINYVKRFHEAGLTVREIAIRNNLPKSTIHRWVKE